MKSLSRVENTGPVSALRRRHARPDRAKQRSAKVDLLHRRRRRPRRSADVFYPQSPRYVFLHSGTFTANLISMTAGMAAMLKFDPTAVARLKRATDRARNGIEGAIRATGGPAGVTGAGSMFLVHMKQAPHRNYRDAYSDARRVALTQGVLLDHLYNEGCSIISTGTCTFSTPMTEAEIDTLVEAFQVRLCQGSWLRWTERAEGRIDSDEVGRESGRQSPTAFTTTSPPAFTESSLASPLPWRRACPEHVWSLDEAIQLLGLRQGTNEDACVAPALTPGRCRMMCPPMEALTPMIRCKHTGSTPLGPSWAGGGAIVMVALLLLTDPFPWQHHGIALA